MYSTLEEVYEDAKKVREKGSLHEKICQRFAEAMGMSFDDAALGYFWYIGCYGGLNESESEEQLLQDRQYYDGHPLCDNTQAIFGKIAIDVILEERQAAKQEAAQRLKEQEDNHIKEMATDIATKAVEAAVEVFMDEKKKDELRLQKEANDRMLAIKREYELMMEQKDAIIQKFKGAAENYKKAYEALKTSIDFTHLTEQFLQLAQKNQYYLALIKEMQNPLDPLLFRAASTGDFESAKAAIRLGADVNVQDHLLDTPLHKAVAADEIAIVRLLLVNGCDPTKANMLGKTADELTENKEIIKLINGYKNPAIQQQPTLSSNSSALFYKGQTPAVDSNNIQPNYTPSNIH